VCPEVSVGITGLVCLNTEASKKAEMESYEALIFVIGVLSIILGWIVIAKPRILAYLVVSGIFWIARAFL